MLRTIKQSVSTVLEIVTEQVRDFFLRKESIGSSKPSRIRFQLEELEARIVPSTNTSADVWIAQSPGDWNVASNWSAGVPTANSNVVFGVLGGPNQDCTMAVPGGTTVASLTIYPQYGSHTLTLNTQLTTGGITMEAGNIAQPNGPGSSITCNGPLDWSGGTIGSQTDGASVLTVSNELSSISYSSQKTLGDNLTIIGVLELTNDDKNQLILTNNANIDINGGGSLWLSCPQPVGITNATGSNGTIINNGQIKTIGATGANKLECVPILNNYEGSVQVGDASDVVTLEIQNANPQNGVSFLNNGGTVTIYTGSTLLAQNGFTQQTGSLVVAGSAGSANINSLTSAVQVIVNGGTVGFTSTNQMLLTQNNFTMNGGTLNLTVDATAKAFDSVGSNGGSITIGNGSSIDVNTINIPAGGMPKGSWAILKANYGKYFGSNANVTVAGGVSWGWNGFEYETDGNNTLTFNLVS